MIDYDFTTSAYNNIDGTSTLKGFELSYKKEVGEDTLVSCNYTRLSAKNQRGERYAAERKRTSNSSRLLRHQQHSYRNKRESMWEPDTIKRIIKVLRRKIYRSQCGREL